MNDAPTTNRFDPPQLAAALGRRNLVFVGLMGAGKTVIGKLVAQALGLPFIDSDQEIETVSTMTIPELFAQYGEPEFRALESRVIDRILKDGPRVVSTGGGAFMNPLTRNVIGKHGISLWLKADLDTLMSRVSRRPTRPLLRNDDPRGTMARLIEERHPVYALADITVGSRNERKEITVREVLAALGEFLAAHPESGEQANG